ncbi:MAG: flagellar filament capping protein FliD [Gammaproteobacteria bacterium]|nr:flagellar filament capping protein FliD [Gammaproteobacteria bacterium]
MTGISSLGIGSGLDLGGLVESLVAAERIPTENRLNRRESETASDLSGIGIMKSALSSFQSSLSAFDDADNFNTRSTSNSDSSALGASVSSDAEVGNYSIDISSVALSQSLATGAYSSTTDTIGTGTIQIRFGTITEPGFSSFAVNADKTTVSINVDSSNNTLAGLKDDINNGNYGVSASIVNDGTGYRLTLTADDTGAENAMEISITDSGDGDHLDSSGLSALAYNASASNLTETQTAADAVLSVNGLAITSASNTLDEVIEGVTLTVKQTTTSSITLGISESTSALNSSIRSVVSSYNEMMGELSLLSSSGSDTTSAGLLVGDASLRNFVSGIRRLMTSQISGLSGSITALADMGITTARDGSLSINESTFTAALADNPTGALALFAPVGQVDDSLIGFNSAADSNVAGSYGINISAIATRGSLTGGTGVNSLTIDSDNDELVFTVDGVSTGTLSLTQGVYGSAAELAAEIQSQINSAASIKDDGLSVTVSYDGNNDRFEFTSNVYGSSSSVEITAIDTNSTADLGLSVASGTDGVDVAGSIGGVTATGEGQTLSISNGFSLEVLGGVTGDRGSIEFSRGFVESVGDFLDGFLDSTNGSLSIRESGLNDSLEGISDERTALLVRLESVQARLVSQFSALDILVSQFQSTGNFLAQQLDNLPGWGNSNKG